MEFTSAQPFLNQNALVQQYGNQMANFQPTNVGAQPNAANLRLRDVLMSQGTSSPYVGASAQAGADAARAGMANQSPLAAARADRQGGNMQQNLQDQALTSMFPVVSQLALGGAQQELGRYQGGRELQQNADTLRLQGMQGAGKLAQGGVENLLRGQAMQGQRMTNKVATPAEALQAEITKAQGMQRMGETSLGNAQGMANSQWFWGTPPDFSGSVNKLQQGANNINQMNSQLQGYGYAPVNAYQYNLQGYYGRP